MKRIRITALLLAVALLLTGCDVGSFVNHVLGVDEIVYYEPEVFSKMKYTRPDMDALEASLDRTCDAAMAGKPVKTILNYVYGFYYAYDAFYTNMSLAYIHYSADLTDSYWEEEYDFCSKNAAAVDAALDELNYTLAACSQRKQLEKEYFGEGFFDDFEDADSVWEPSFMDLLDDESELLDKYYDLTEESGDDWDTNYDEMAQLLVDLIAVRQEIAAEAGYDTYPEFAYDFYHYRDYTPQQAETYCENIRDALYEPYIRLDQSDVWEKVYLSECSEKDTYRYVQTAANAMGGTFQEAFKHLDTYELCDISYSDNKFTGSFEVYLWTYASPFIFMYPYGDATDQLTFAHEFGHFCNDYACNGSYAATDVAEVHSQAFEYMSLLYGKDTELLTRYKMADSLCVYMEQAAYALFEQQAYRLTGEELTAENVARLYEEVCLSFGFDSWGWDPRDFVTVHHFYTEPMYMISYVVSNDLALQFYQLELDKKGEGLKLYEESLLSQDSYILDFADAYGLESPFAKGRMKKLSGLFNEMFPAE